MYRPDLIQNLLRNMIEPTDAHIKEATMQAVGYMCQDLPDGALTPDERNALLTAIVAGTVFKMMVMMMRRYAGGSA